MKPFTEQDFRDLHERVARRRKDKIVSAYQAKLFDTRKDAFARAGEYNRKHYGVLSGHAARPQALITGHYVIQIDEYVNRNRQHVGYLA